MFTASMKALALLSFFLLSFSCNKSGSTNPAPPPTSDTTPVSPPPRFNINANLVTPNPTKEAVALYQFLKDNYGKKIISGVMTLSSFDETNWLKTNTGKEPAIVGLDFMHCNRNYNWYDNDQPIKDAKTYWDKNGIPAMMWHWRDPSRNTEAFYTNQTSFDVSKIN